jgi:predicted component of type VI protein secretion system
VGSRGAEFRELGQLVTQQLRGPVAEQVRRKVAEWRDPRARLLRRRRRAMRATGAWATVTAALAGGCGLEIAVAHSPVAAVVLGGFAAGAGVVGVRSGTRTYRLHRMPLPEPPRPPAALPPRESAAREPMERLAAAEATLEELLRQLSRPIGGVLQVPAESVVQARATAAEGAAALREAAEQLRAVERAREHAPPLERGPLLDGIRRLRGQLDEGVDGYGGLVAAAARALAASSQAMPRRALADATDHLAGLAVALRELSHGAPN